MLGHSCIVITTISFPCNKEHEYHSMIYVHVTNNSTQEQAETNCSDMGARLSIFETLTRSTRGRSGSVRGGGEREGGDRYG